MSTTPKGRPTYKAPGAVSLYWQRLGTGRQVFLALVGVWVIAIFVIAILISIRVLPPVAGLWLFVGLIPLGGWAQWLNRATRYARAERDDTDM